MPSLVPAPALVLAQEPARSGLHMPQGQLPHAEQHLYLKRWSWALVCVRCHDWQQSWWVPLNLELKQFCGALNHGFPDATNRCIYRATL